MATRQDKLSPTEQRIYHVLSDGEPHAASELVGCLYDNEDGELSTVDVHISVINKKLKSLKPGYQIMSVNGRGPKPRYSPANKLFCLVRRVSDGE